MNVPSFAANTTANLTFSIEPHPGMNWRVLYTADFNNENTQANFTDRTFVYAFQSPGQKVVSLYADNEISNGSFVVSCCSFFLCQIPAYVLISQRFFSLGAESRVTIQTTNKFRLTSECFWDLTASGGHSRSSDQLDSDSRRARHALSEPHVVQLEHQFR